MNCSLTLSQRLSLVFTVVLLFCAAVTCGVHIYSSNLYGNAMVQRLSAGLAQQIVITEPLLDNRGQVNHRTLKSLFERLMTLNPSVELYIVSPEGRLLVEAAPPGHIKRRYINIAPLKKFLSGAVWPVYGDDPRSVNKKKVFSTAPLYLRDDLKGYLYIILQGEELNALTDAAWTKADVFHFGANFQHRRATFHLQIFNDGNAVAVSQQIAVSIFNDQLVAFLCRFCVVPFVGTFRADVHAVIFVGVFGVAFWAVW